MVNDLTKRAGPAALEQAGETSSSHLKTILMEDALGRMFGEDGEKTVSGTPRVVLGLAHHAAQTDGWGRAKVLQRAMFQAAAASGLELKFAFYAADDDAGVRRCRVTKRWFTDPDDMAAVIDRAECRCGCFVNISDVLAQAVKEGEERPLRAVIVIGDAFHDDQDGLDEAAIAANQLRRAGTRVFLMQFGEDPATESKLRYVARVSGGTYFQFDPRTQERQFEAMWNAMSIYAAGGEAAVATAGGHAATLLLQRLKQSPMPIIEERARGRERLPLEAPALSQDPSSR
jgi:hypothetical protein